MQSELFNTIHFGTSKICNTNHVEVRNQTPQDSHTLEVVGYICNESQANYEMLQENNTITKIHIYVQRVGASIKFFSQAKNDLMKEHPESLLVTLSLSEGMMFMNSVNNEELCLFYTLLVGVAIHHIIHFGCILVSSFTLRNTLRWTLPVTKLTSL